MAQVPQEQEQAPIISTPHERTIQTKATINSKGGDKKETVGEPITVNY